MTKKEWKKKALYFADIEQQHIRTIEEQENELEKLKRYKRSYEVLKEEFENGIASEGESLTKRLYDMSQTLKTKDLEKVSLEETIAVLQNRVRFLESEVESAKKVIQSLKTRKTKKQ